MTLFGKKLKLMA